MTTIAAYRAGKTVHLAADQRINPAATYRLDGALTKILQHTNEDSDMPVMIGVSGPVTGLQALELFLEGEGGDFSSAFNVYRTILNFRNDLVTNQLCVTDRSADHAFALFPMQLLIVNSEGRMFTVYNFGECIEHESMCAVGSGMPFALGAMHAAEDLIRPNLKAAVAEAELAAVGEKILMAGMSAAANFDPATGPDFDYLTQYVTHDES